MSDKHLAEHGDDYVVIDPAEFPVASPGDDIEPDDEDDT